MKPPTKFELMRIRRYRVQARIAQEAETQEALKTEEPAVPTMEIDGVKFAERHCGGDWHDCAGCYFLFAEDEECELAADTGALTFGDRCSNRSVIYIKAE